MTLKPPYVPFPIIAGVVIALVAHFALMRTSYGSILRGSGGNPKAIERAGWSLLEDQGDDVRARRLLRHAGRALR